MGIWTQSNTSFLGSTRVHNPNGISIASPVFAQFTSGCCQACPPQNYPFAWDLDLHLIHGSSGPRDSASQTTSRLVQPSLHICPHSVPILYIGATSPPLKIAPSYGDLLLWAHVSPQPKEHHNRFSHFCRAHYCDRPTD